MKSDFLRALGGTSATSAFDLPIDPNASLSQKKIGWADHAPHDNLRPSQ
jgi:hypothetical protein